MSWVSGWKLWGPPVSLSYELINSVVIPVAKLIHFGDKCLGWKWMEMTSDIGDSPSVSQCQAKTEHFLGWKTSPFTQQLFVKKWAIICQQRGIFWDGKPLHLCSNYLSLCCVTEVEECHMDSLHCGLVAFSKIQMWIHDIKSDEGGKAWNWKAPGWGSIFVIICQIWWKVDDVDSSCFLSIFSPIATFCKKEIMVHRLELDMVVCNERIFNIPMSDLLKSLVKNSFYHLQLKKLIRTGAIIWYDKKHSRLNHMYVIFFVFLQQISYMAFLVGWPYGNLFLGLPQFPNTSSWGRPTLFL